MPEISLTDFVDFVLRSGSAKVTKVREIIDRPPYSPLFDFWKPLREGIVTFHRGGGADKRKLDAILEGLTDPKKSVRYPGAVGSYKRFLGRKKIGWFEPPSDTWSYGGVDVRVNPELGLVVDGQASVAKLYFKGEARRKDHLGIVTEAMRVVLASKSPPGSSMAVLDVSKGKLLIPAADAGVVTALLAGEALAFAEIWRRLSI